MKVDLSENVLPLDEEYMSIGQLDYFKAKLLRLRSELIRQTTSTKEDLKNTWLNSPDMFDVAATTTDLVLDLKGFDRNQNQLREIDKALARIEAGDYGYCEISGEEIGLRRLEVQPLATLCIEIQEMLERKAKDKTYSNNSMNNYMSYA